MMPKKVSKFYDGRRLVVAVRTKDLDEAKTIANEIFKVRKNDLNACYAIIKRNEMLYDGNYGADRSNAVAVYRKQED